MNPKNERANAVASAKQVVVKAGTRLLIDRERIAALVDGIAAIRESGRRVLLVSSGAVGMGMTALNLTVRPRELAKIQALAAIGQTRLMSIYAEECARHGFQVAQLLLTAADLRSRERYLNVMNCINVLWESGVLPIVNENDSVSVDELKFGDNDKLAGMLGSLTGSRLTVLLTTVDGLRNRDPEGNLAERISTVSRLNDTLRGLAGGTDDSRFSIGGMASKLTAANLVTSAGEYLWIADGRQTGVLRDILAGKDIGTLFLPVGKRMPGYKRWISFFSRSNGKIVVDPGAEKALCSGKSLLPSGVVSLEGEFRRGDTVDVLSSGGISLGRGLVNFSAADARKLIGLKSAAVHDVLGTDADEELIHRDHLCLLNS